MICRIGFLIYHIFVFSGIEDWDEKKREVGRWQTKGVSTIKVASGSNAVLVLCVCPVFCALCFVRVLCRACLGSLRCALALWSARSAVGACFAVVCVRLWFVVVLGCLRLLCLRRRVALPVLLAFAPPPFCVCCALSCCAIPCNRFCYCLRIGCKGCWFRLHHPWQSNAVVPAQQLFGVCAMSKLGSVPSPAMHSLRAGGFGS